MAENIIFYSISTFFALIILGATWPPDVNKYKRNLIISLTVPAFIIIAMLSGAYEASDLNIAYMLSRYTEHSIHQSHAIKLAGLIFMVSTWYIYICLSVLAKHITDRARHDRLPNEPPDT
jgi:hypothetical protein